MHSKHPNRIAIRSDRRSPCRQATSHPGHKENMNRIGKTMSSPGSPRRRPLDMAALSNDRAPASGPTKIPRTFARAVPNCRRRAAAKLRNIPESIHEDGPVLLTLNNARKTMRIEAIVRGPNPPSHPRLPAKLDFRTGMACLLLAFLGCGVLGCSSPQNCAPNPGYPGYPAYPAYPQGYTLPSGTTVPTVGAPNMGTAAAPPMMGQPIPGSVPAYPTMAPGQPIPPGYSTGIPAR